MPETFAPPKNPSRGGVTIEEKPDVIRASFGDGYSQRTAAGINNKALSVTLTWRGLSQSHRDEIMGFFRARGGVQAFNYTLPLDSDVRLWTAGKYVYNSSALGVNRWDLTASLQEEFDL